MGVEGRDTNVFEYESLAMVLLKKQENFVNCPFHDDPVSLNYLVGCKLAKTYRFGYRIAQIPELVLSESEASEKDSHSLLPESAEHVAVGSYACSLYKNKVRKPVSSTECLVNFTSPYFRIPMGK